MPRALGIALLLLLALFLVLTTAAGLLYPGGTWCDRNSQGFDLAFNYLCDLLHGRGLNGAPNPGARLAQTGMVLLSLSMIPFWLGVARLSTARPRLAGATRALGIVAAIGTLIVSLNPSDRFPAFHQLAVLTTTGASLAAAVAGMVGLRSSAGGRGLAALAALALGLVGVDGGLYLEQVLNPRDCAVLLPVLQKFAGLAALAWMVGVAVRLLREPIASAKTTD